MDFQKDLDKGMTHNKFATLTTHEKESHDNENVVRREHNIAAFDPARS